MKDYLEDYNNTEEPLEINDSSLYELEQELKNYSKQSGKLQRAYSEITKEVNSLTTRLKIITAQMVERIVKKYEDQGQKISFANKDVIRKIEVPLEKEWQEVQSQLDEASTQQSYLLGICLSMSAKSKRLTELFGMTTKYKSDELYIPKTAKRFEDLGTMDGMDMEE
jgi:chromosome segregation ATPase